MRVFVCIAFSLGEGVDNHIVFGFLELYCRVPLLVEGHFLRALFDESSIKPKVKLELV